jgi:hypothetical protein
MNEETIKSLIEVGKQLSAIAGAIGIICSLAASKLPRDWPLTQLLARFFADTRDIRGQVAPRAGDDA